jgi:hypothetical protein
MTEFEDLKAAVDREIARARRNIDEFRAVQESVWFNLAKSRALRDEPVVAGVTWGDEGTRVETERL